MRKIAQKTLYGLLRAFYKIGLLGIHAFTKASTYNHYQKQPPTRRIGTMSEAVVIALIGGLFGGGALGTIVLWFLNRKTRKIQDYQIDSTASKTYAEAAKEIAEMLQQERAQAQKERDAWQKERDNWQIERETWQVEREHDRKQYADLYCQVETLGSENVSLRQEVADLRQQIAGIRTENERLKAEREQTQRKGRGLHA